MVIRSYTVAFHSGHSDYICMNLRDEDQTSHLTLCLK